MTQPIPNPPMPRPGDAAELAVFERFLVERAAHWQMERVLGRPLPFDTVDVPHEWWDPDGLVPRRNLAPDPKEPPDA